MFFSSKNICRNSRTITLIKCSIIWQKNHYRRKNLPLRRCHLGTPTKRSVSKRQVSKHPFKTSETSGLQNVSFTKRQVVKTSGLQNVRLQKKHPYILCTCGWWKSAGSVAAMFAGCVLFSILEVFCHISPQSLVISKNDTLFT